MQSEVLVRFLKSIGIENPEDFDLDLTYCGRNAAKKDTFDFVFIKKTPWVFDQYLEFTSGLSRIDYPYDFCFTYLKPPTLNEIYDFFLAWHQYTFRLPYPFVVEIFNNRLTFIFETQQEFTELSYRLNDFKECLHFLNYTVTIDHKINDHIAVSDFIDTASTPVINDKTPINEEEDASFEDNNDYIEKTDLDLEDSDFERKSLFEDEEEIIEEVPIQKEVKVESRPIKKASNISYFTKDNRESFPRPKDSYFRELQTISQATKLDEFVAFKANIFIIEAARTNRRRQTIHRFGLKDKLNNPIFITITEDLVPQLAGGYLKSFKARDNVYVSGIVRVNNFNGEYEIETRYIELLDNSLLRDDTSPEKRIELHLHTNMSALDGVGSMTDYINLAKHMGHKAIALTDHGVVQSFPEAQKIAKKTGMKILYGAELYMVEDHLPYITNPCDTQLINAPYIAFDLETTGLSSRYDRIVEIGAVKVQNGIVVDKLSLLINPKMKISKSASRVSGITDEDVADKPVIEEVIDQILNFFGSNILITHNAVFDIEFMNATLVRLGRPKLTNPSIDTLSLSRAIYTASKAHSLKALSKKVGVRYDEDLAHRALYDAEVLHEVWQSIADTLEKETPGITHANLDGLVSSSEMIKYARPTHVVVLAKNKQGIKDLFELITLSHVEYISSKNGLPKIPRSELAKRRENLLIGSACFNGDVFDTAMTKNEEVLLDRINFYDYIEVQPLDNYDILLRNEKILNRETLIQIISDIISGAKKASKMVVATGDCHYVNPEDKVYRDVYIYTEGLGGRPHPLSFKDTEGNPLPTPNQHFRSTNEMLEAFSFLNDPEFAHEIVVTNPNKINDMIEELHPIVENLHPPYIENVDNLLRELCYHNAHEMYGKTLPDAVQDRLDRELNGIIGGGYAVIYYIAYKIIEHANSDGELVGSRGSVGSSFAAHMANITEVNPLAPHYRCPSCKHFEFSTDPQYRSGYDLPSKECPECGHPMIGDGQNIPFETFLGIDAGKTPDIDLNFSENYQAIAHDYTKVLLGEKNVFRAGTIGTVAIKTAIAKARDYYKIMGKTAPTQAEAVMLAAGCVDVKRTSGQHPGGIVVVPNNNDVTDFTPIQYPADDKESAWKTTHFDFHSLHDTLLKLDLLGHVDPYALRLMSDLTNINPLEIPLNDPKVVSLFSSRSALVPPTGRNYLKEKTGALGLPEFGTPFVRGILVDTQPKCIADLIAISGLSHGTDVWQGNAQSLIQSGEMNLQQVIACRDDIMIYLVNKGIDNLTAFNITEDVRKGNKVKPEFQKIMREHKVPEYYIDSCNKIKYMFPKAHATAYVTMALRVGYFKVYYPLAYYAVYFSVRTDKYDIDAMLSGQEGIEDRIKELQDLKANRKIENKEEEILSNLQVVIEMYERGFKILPLDINRSDAKQFIIDETRNGLIPPFSVVDSLGSVVAQSIIEQRNIKEFSSKEDFNKRCRVSTTIMKKLEALGLFKDLRENEELNLFDYFN